jgi:sec-independent protein translocase protein TatA
MLSIFLEPSLLLSMPGESEWLLILLVILLFFGGKKIPDLMRGIGKGVREFNDAKEHVKKEIEAGMKEKDVEKKEIVNDPVPAPDLSSNPIAAATASAENS